MIASMQDSKLLLMMQVVIGVVSVKAVMSVASPGEKRTTMAKTPQLMTFCGSLVSSCSCPRAPLPVISSPMQAQRKPVTAVKTTRKNINYLSTPSTRPDNAVITDKIIVLRRLDAPSNEALLVKLETETYWLFFRPRSPSGG